VVDHAVVLDATLPVTVVVACRAAAALPPSPARRALPGPGSLLLPPSEAVGGREVVDLVIPTVSALLAPDVDNPIHFAGHGLSIHIWSLTFVLPVRDRLSVDVVADHGSMTQRCAVPDSWRPTSVEAVTPAELGRCIDDLARRSDHGDGSRIQWLARRTHHQIQGVVVDEVVLWAESAPDDQEGSRAGRPGKCPVE
jgi:hypothetical protein